MQNDSLNRFLEAQNSRRYGSSYEEAFAEMQRGRKVSHWIWYIFPQLRGLGRSSTSFYFGLENREEAEAYLSTITGVALGSDAFFPFSDNIERAKKSGVSYIAEPGGSKRDDLVIECCDKYNIAMAFTGMRLFHH